MSNAYEEQKLVELTTATSQDEEIEGRVGLLLGAAAKNDVQRILKLLRSGVINSNSVDYDKRSALHLAASEGHMESAKLLVLEKADPNLKDRFGLSPLDEAVRSQRSEVATFLKENGAVLGAIGKHEGDLIQGASDGNYQLVKNLLESGVNANCADYDRRTPLHLATGQGRLEVVELLLKHGADPKLADRWGGTALDEVGRHAVRTGKNHMKILFEAYIEQHEPEYFNSFNIFFGIFELAIIILLCACTKYGATSPSVPGVDLPGSSVGVLQMARYPFLQDVNVMIFVGFGYLMTFLRKNAYNSLGLTFLIGAFCVQWHILAGGFFHQVFAGHGFHKIEVTSDDIILGDFAAGAVLITYGVLLGKVSPFQMMFIAILEVVFFTVNENIGLMMGISDIGGSMVIHMFGAFFGIAASIAMKNKDASDNDSNAAVYHSDLFAMIGTVFLWMFWPSFNAAFGIGDQQHRAVLNSCLSLAGSCVAAYIASHIFRAEKRFNMVDIQNATLAGGVAMGTCADMYLNPGAAVAVGAVGGIVSVAGYVFVQPMLEEKLGLHDTCGVNNLHGLPSLVGAIAGAIAASFANAEDYGDSLGNTFSSVADGSRTASEQAGLQAIFMAITLGMSIVGGSFTAMLVNSPKFLPVKKEDLFQDERYWEVPELETPYYFDHRGEISRLDPVASRKENVAKIGVDTRVSRLEQRLAVVDEQMMNGTVATVGSSKLEVVFEKLIKKLDKSE